MRKTDEQIKQKKRERFEYHAVRLAEHLGLARVNSYNDLPAPLKEHLERLPYGRVVSVFLKIENKQGATIGELARRYGLCKTRVHTYINED